MKVLVTGEFVDFEAPIQMTDEQGEKFINFMKTLFPDVEIINGVQEKDRFVGERESDFKYWSQEEYYELLSSETNEELASKLGRSEMSVGMKRAEFVPKFFGWAKKKGYTKITKDIFKEFLEEVGV